MTDKKRITLDDRDPEIHDLFPFKKYAQVIIDKDGLDGTVINAEYVEGQAHHYSITYTVKSNRDGSLRELPLADIVHLNRDRPR